MHYLNFFWYILLCCLFELPVSLLLEKHSLLALFLYLYTRNLLSTSYLEVSMSTRYTISTIHRRTKWYIISFTTDSRDKLLLAMHDFRKGLILNLIVTINLLKWLYNWIRLCHEESLNLILVLFSSQAK